MSTEAQPVAARSHRIGVARLALTGAMFMTFFYLLCWSGAALGVVPVSHMYPERFSSAPIPSSAMLIEGSIWSYVFGSLAGTHIALLYNALGSVDRRN